VALLLLLFLSSKAAGQLDIFFEKIPHTRLFLFLPLPSGPPPQLVRPIYLFLPPRSAEQARACGVPLYFTGSSSDCSPFPFSSISTRSRSNGPPPVLSSPPYFTDDALKSPTCFPDSAFFIDRPKCVVALLEGFLNELCHPPDLPKRFSSSLGVC